MKRMIIAAPASVALVAGLVAGPSPLATAAPYPGTVDTNTSVSAPASVDRGDSARITVRVSSAGDARPKGTVTVTVKRKKGGYTFSDTKSYRGGKIAFRTGALNKRGAYVVRAKFDAKPQSVFKDSSDSTSFRVS